MRVLLITDRWGLGGGLEHMFQIARGMADVRFTVGAAVSPHTPGVAPAESPAERFRLLDNVRVVDGPVRWETLVPGDHDLIHVHHLKPLLDLYRKRLLSVLPVMFTVHGIHLHKYEFSRTAARWTPASRLKYHARLFLERMLYRRVQRLIAVSEEDGDRLRSWYGNDRVRTIPNGIAPLDMDAGSPVRQRIRRDLGLKGDRFLFVTVARFNFQKGYDVLLRALARDAGFLRARSVTFVLLGDGPEFQRIRRLARRRHLDDLVIFAGARPDARRVIAAADVFLLPSRWEGLPLVLLECGLLKIPVLASDTFGNREILTGGRGVLFPNLDARALALQIRRILEGAYPLKRMAATLCRRVEEHHTLDRMIDALRVEYRSLGASDRDQ